MWDFLQIYGIWIVFGVLFFLMMRMHSGGMHGNGMGGGCGMGMDHEHHQHDEPSNTQRAIPLDSANDDTRNETFVRDVPAEEEEIPLSQYPVGHSTGR